MQADFHREVTCYLAIKAGFRPKQAGLIAWANQNVDDNTEGGLHELRTACRVTADWHDKTVQLLIFVMFHFLPGDSEPWVVTANNCRARELVEASLGDLVRLGIALHTFQDTFTHQHFTGWEEKLNACFAFRREQFAKVARLAQTAPPAMVAGCVQ